MFSFLNVVDVMKLSVTLFCNGATSFHESACSGKTLFFFFFFGDVGIVNGILKILRRGLSQGYSLVDARPSVQHGTIS